MSQFLATDIFQSNRSKSPFQMSEKLENCYD